MNDFYFYNLFRVTRALGVIVVIMVITEGHGKEGALAFHASAMYTAASAMNVMR